MMVAASLDIAKLFPLAIFGAFAASVWLLLDWWAQRRPRAEERLSDLRDPRPRRAGGGAQGSKTSNTMARMLERATPALSKPLQPKSDLEASNLKRKLAHAGFRNEAAPGLFLSLKFVGLVLGIVLGGGAMMLFSGFAQATLIRTVGLAGTLFYLPDILLFLLARRRKEAIFLGLPDALDLMVVCVEAGLGLDQAMRKVAEEMKKSFRSVAEEFALSNLQLQMGRPRTQVLQEMGQRSGVEDLRALAAILIQADKFGSSIAQALRAQSDAMRVRRRQIAEEKASKTAVKLIFPLVLFIFPGIFVVLVGPAAITMIREMFPAMAGSG